MRVRILILSLQALVVSILMSVTASAVTLTPDDPTLFPLIYGTEYNASNSFGKNVTETDTYHFSAVNSAAIWEGSFSPSGAFITLSAQWVDITTSTIVSTTNMIATSGSFMITLIGGHAYDLIISVVTANTTGPHGYNLAISAVPLPPAIFLLISGLLGIGALGRRRRGVTTVKV